MCVLACISAKLFDNYFILKPRWIVDVAYTASASMAGIVSKGRALEVKVSNSKEDRKRAYEYKVMKLREIRSEAAARGEDIGHYHTPRAPASWSDSQEDSDDEVVQHRRRVERLRDVLDPDRRGGAISAPGRARARLRSATRGRI